MRNDDADEAYLVDGKYAIGDLVAMDELHTIFERFTEATGYTIGFLDHPGLNVLVATGWRDICTKFHRVCPASAANCTKANRRLLDQLKEPGQMVIERCDNGLVDCAAPIIVKGKHIASLATGQFLLEEADTDRFRRQAELFGFDVHEYLEALKDIPVVSEGKIRSVTAFLGEMAHLISRLGYSNLIAKEESLRLENEIAERKRAELALRESEERYRQIARCVPDLIWTMDLSGRFTYANSAVERTHGYTVEEFLKLNFRDTSSPKTAATHAAMIEKELAEAASPQYDRNTIRTFESEELRKDGSALLVEVSAVFLWSDDGKPAGIIGTTRDITERKRAQEEKEKLEAQLFQAQKMESVARLAGGVAHDFNNMLGVIIGRAEMALDTDISNDGLRRNLHEILKAGQRSADLTRQLLAFARKQTAVPKILDLNDTISGMLKMLHRLIGEDIDLLWIPGLDLWNVKIDPSQVDQILANLAVNARDAISGVGAITLRTENVVIDDPNRAENPEFVPGDYVLLSVSDTGAGMSKEVLEKVFEPFFTTKELGKGTGLGLSTIYGIVKQNDGYIYVASQPGKGTTFKLYLPRFGSETALVPCEESAGKRPTGTETILVVEDDEAILNLAKLILENLGYTVLAARTPIHAIQLVEEHPGDFHLLITDVVMPGMNGRQLVERLRTIRPALKCLYMSGYTADVIAHRGVLDKGVNFIQKPFGCDDLAASVRQVLDHSE
jgi:PAS domain S-box-containing protein